MPPEALVNRENQRVFSRAYGIYIFWLIQNFGRPPKLWIQFPGADQSSWSAEATGSRRGGGV